MNDSLADAILEKADAESHWVECNNRLGHLCTVLNATRDRKRLRMILQLISAEYTIVADILERLDLAEQTIESHWHEAAVEVAANVE